MKKILFGVLAVALGALSSCTKEDLNIDKETIVDPVQFSISIDLSNFYSSYTFDDSKHNIDQIAEAYRTFNSEYGKFIEVRTLFYNRNTDELVDSIVNYVTNTNAVTQNANLLPGDYYAVTTLAFADKDNESYLSFWRVDDKEKLSTAKLYPENRYSKWSILSYSIESFSVSDIHQPQIYTTPSPLGALVYFYAQNFQFLSEETYGYVADNKVREIAIYTQRKAESYNLNPNASSKFNYFEETSSGSWYYNYYYMPNEFVDNDGNAWTHFMSNLYGYYYVLEPEQHIIFGLEREGDSSFSGYGEQNITYTSGKIYLAYWDYFKVGAPYMGVADNDHWNSYTVKTLYEEPNTTWGSSLATIKSQMETKGYTLYSEGTNWLLYLGRYQEYAYEYDFNTSDQLNSVYYYFNPSISLEVLSDYVAKNSGAKYMETLSDGTIEYMTPDSKTKISIYEYTYPDESKANIVRYMDNTVSSLARQVCRGNTTNQVKNIN